MTDDDRDRDQRERDDSREKAQQPNPTPKTAKPDAPISSTSAEGMPVGEKDLHLKTGREFEQQKWNDATSIPASPIRQGEPREEENKSEGTWDTGLNEPVPEGDATSNIGKL